MINQTEIPLYLEEAIPAISQDLEAAKKNNAFDVMQTLIAFTFKNIKTHNYNVVRRCFHIAENLYTKGNYTVQNAVQNVFVYSFTKMFQTYSDERTELVAMLPLKLHALYMAQVHQRGC